MKITYVVEDFSICGGVERIVSGKAGTLSAEYGHEVTIISVYEDPRPANYPMDKSVNTVFLHVPMAKKSYNAAVMTFNRIKTLVKAAARLDEALKRINPGIIFFTTTLGALLLPLCRTKAAKVYESHLARPFNPHNAFFRFTELCADMIVCLTGGDAAEYRHARKVKVIPNFIDKPSTTVKDYNVKKAVAVGRLEAQKGFDILIDIWKDVIKERPDWHLDIYGEGPLRDELQGQIDKSGLDAFITLCGRCDNIMDRYAGYSLHLMSSRYEGLPMTLIEAQSCALPSVVTDFKYGARDIITDGLNGLIVPQDDTKAFAAAILRLTADSSLRAEYGAHARTSAAKFSKENVMPQWIKLIEGI